MSAWDIYPRPQLKRASWQCLNGIWQVNGAPAYVPACRTEEKIEYVRDFEFTRTDDVVLLHFCAADQVAEVSLNGRYLGQHRGGYLPFTFDISEAVAEGTNRLLVTVTDTLDHTYPYGKQRKDHGGMWYTPMSGIWQTVWIEQVPDGYIRSVRVTPDLYGALFEVDCPQEAEIEILGKTYRTEGGRVRAEIEDPHLWTCGDPFLYTAFIRSGRDCAEVYFALRTVDIRDIDGISRVCLNGKPVFLHGVLDQGYFSPGLMLPGDPAEYERDVLRVKSLGFNTIRKHIKIEPEAFYHACDRLGMLVIQDMVNSGDYSFFRDTLLGTIGAPVSDKGGKAPEREAFFTEHCRKTVEHLYSHPCIAVWTVFNEGWGQFDSDRHYRLFKEWDPTRLVDSTSGWFGKELSDFDSRHIYFRTPAVKGPGKKGRPIFISECGGYTLDVSGAKGKTYGYGKCAGSAELTEKIASLYKKMIIPAIGQGCCGCIYTQLSDIEEEINGLYSCDRSVCKVDRDAISRLAEALLR
ncbi:MAG: glycoside hydrolase family 2 [Firmicutes bacterium]|nr:glycoside hydrolase family 2 [Bacillota bacterium]